MIDRYTPMTDFYSLSGIIDHATSRLERANYITDYMIDNDRYPGNRKGPAHRIWNRMLNRRDKLREIIKTTNFLIENKRYL